MAKIEQLKSLIAREVKRLVPIEGGTLELFTPVQGVCANCGEPVTAQLIQTARHGSELLIRIRHLEHIGYPDCPGARLEVE